MTTDADLAIERTLLGDAPDVAQLLIDASFTNAGQPGHWVDASDIAIDLMIAPHQSGRGRSARAADLRPHPRSVARIGPGLAPALVDNAETTVGSLEPDDVRTHRLRVAGPAALLVAKCIKIGDRLADADAGRPDRVVDKDALDILRLLQAVDTSALVTGQTRYEPGEPAGADVEQALEILSSSATATARIPQAAARAALGDPTVAPSLSILANDLLTALGRNI